MVTLTKKDLEEIKDIARRLFREYSGSFYYGGQLDRDIYLMKALEHFLIKRGLTLEFTIDEQK